MAEETQSDITALTVQLLSAFVSNNKVSSDSLSELIQSTRAALMEDPAAATAVPAAPEYVPAVSIRKSLSSPDHVLSLIDGRPYKTLKRHLATHGLTPDQYRERYNLPHDYPLVARSYSEARRSVAEKHGLGKKPAVAAAKAPVASAAQPSPAAPKADAASRKAPAAPAKKPAKATAPVAAKGNAAKASATTEPKPAAAKAAPRKRLSIATPKDGPSKLKTAPEAPSAAPASAKAPTKTKTAAKPGTFKAALAAAGAHLNADEPA